MMEATPATFMPGGFEWVVIAIVALLVFGRRLPDVARSLGKSIVEFKKGIRDVKDDIDTQSRIENNSQAKLENHTPSSDTKSPPTE